MSTIDTVIGMLGKDSLVYAEARLRSEFAGMTKAQGDARKIVLHNLARYLAGKLEPLHREFVDRRDDRGNVYLAGEPAPFEAFGPGHDMVVHGELFVLSRAQYDALVEAIMQVKRELEFKELAK